MKTIAKIVVLAYVILFPVTAPINSLINTRMGVPLYVFAMIVLAGIMVAVVIKAFPPELELLPGTENFDAQRAQDLSNQI